MSRIEDLSVDIFPKINRSFYEARYLEMKRLKARRMELEDKKITSWNEKTKLRSENSNFRKERWGILFFQIC